MYFFFFFKYSCGYVTLILPTMLFCTLVSEPLGAFLLGENSRHGVLLEKSYYQSVARHLQCLRVSKDL